MITLSTSTWMDNDRMVKDPSYTAKDMLESFKAAGFDYLDANLWKFSDGNGPLTRDNWREWAYEFKEEADKAGITFRQSHGVTIPDRFWDSADSSARDHMIKMLPRCIEATKILGAEWMVLHPMAFFGDKLYSAKKAKEETVRFISPYLDMSKKFGIGIAMECMRDNNDQHRRYCAGDASELIELVDEFNDKSLGMCIDTGHAHESGLDVPSFIRAAGSRLKCTHINDNMKFEDSHFPMFFGDIDWVETVKALREIGYDGDFSLEVHPQRFPANMREPWYRFLHDLGQRILDIV